MKINLCAIDESNRDGVLLLKVSERQKSYIASNKESLETAAREEYRTIAKPYAIYADDLLVGFTMFAFDSDYADPYDRYWLWRFMIDEQWQGKGYGSAALETVIAYFRSNGADHIRLSTKPSNTAALSLYHRYQFKETGEMNDEEIVLQLVLSI